MMTRWKMAGAGTFLLAVMLASGAWLMRGQIAVRFSRITRRPSRRPGLRSAPTSGCDGDFIVLPAGSTQVLKTNRPKFFL